LDEKGCEIKRFFMRDAAMSVGNMMLLDDMQSLDDVFRTLKVIGFSI